MPPGGIRRKVLEPNGRTVVLTEEAWQHIVSEHRELARYEQLIMETVSHPVDTDFDDRPGRERYFTEGRGPSRFFCVVVQFDGDEGEVVTAFPHRNER